MSALPANPLRGEADVRIGAIDFRIAVTFGGLARLSQALKAQTMDEIFVRLVGFEPFAVLCAIRCLAVAETDDEVSALCAKVLAEGNISYADQLAWVAAIEHALNSHIDAGKRVRENITPADIAETAVLGNPASLS
ncbi:hypothetical protein ASD32_05080 [Rhizobium sp. Root483D2]|nr:hypothetical protein ASD32_05080 [Rhizobium sp. Root483D2]